MCWPRARLEMLQNRGLGIGRFKSNSYLRIEFYQREIALCAFQMLQNRARCSFQMLQNRARCCFKRMVILRLKLCQRESPPRDRHMRISRKNILESTVIDHKSIQTFYVKLVSQSYIGAHWNAVDRQVEIRRRAWLGINILQHYLSSTSSLVSSELLNGRDPGRPASTRKAERRSALRFFAPPPHECDDGRLVGQQPAVRGCSENIPGRHGGFRAEHPRTDPW